MELWQNRYGFILDIAILAVIWFKNCLIECISYGFSIENEKKAVLQIYIDSFFEKNVNKAVISHHKKLIQTKIV